MELTELLKILAWLMRVSCRDCARGTTALINKKGRISVFCPRHAMEYIIPTKKVSLPTKIRVSLPDHIGPADE